MCGKLFALIEKLQKENRLQMTYTIQLSLLTSFPVSLFCRLSFLFPFSTICLFSEMAFSHVRVNNDKPINDERK